jgi:hypothetical protein
MSHHRRKAPIQASRRSYARIVGLPKEVPADLSVVTEFEAQHLGALQQGQWLFGFTNLQRFRTGRHRLWHNVFRRFDAYISSTAVRNACVLYSIYHHGEMIPNHQAVAQTYLVSFYRAAQDVITREAFGELVYSCYAVCIYALRTKRNIKEVFQHADAFRRSVTSLITNEVLDSEEKFFLECMWEKMLWYIARAIMFRSPPTLEHIAHLETICQPLALADYSIVQADWMDQGFHEIKAKLDFIQVSLLLVKLPPTVDSVRVAQFLTLGFFEDMGISPSGRPILRHIGQDRASSSAMARLWLELFGLIMSLLRGTHGDAAAGPILSILNLVTSMEPQRSIAVMDMTLYCLVLAGLVASLEQENLLPLSISVNVYY